MDELLRRGEGMKQIVGDAYPYPLPVASDEEMEKAILERVSTGYRELRFPRLCYMWLSS